VVEVVILVEGSGGQFRWHRQPLLLSVLLRGAHPPSVRKHDL